MPVVAREAKLNRRPPSAFPTVRKRHPPRGERVAHLEFAAERVRVARPLHLPHELAATIDINVVHVREPETETVAPTVPWASPLFSDLMPEHARDPAV